MCTAIAWRASPGRLAPSAARISPCLVSPVPERDNPAVLNQAVAGFPNRCAARLTAARQFHFGQERPGRQLTFDQPGFQNAVNAISRLPLRRLFSGEFSLRPFHHTPPGRYSAAPQRDGLRIGPENLSDVLKSGPVRSLGRGTE